MFRKKTPISVNLTIGTDRGHCPLQEPLRGVVKLSTNDSLHVKHVHVHLEAYLVFYDSKQQPSETKKFYESTPVLALGPKNSHSNLVIPAGTHPIPFALPPINCQVSTSCGLPDKMQVQWKVVASVTLEKVNEAIRGYHDIFIHPGRQIAINNAPGTVVMSRQKFLTHQPIHYRITLHKTVFIAEEMVAMTVYMKNESRMALLTLECTLKQEWETHKRTEIETVMRFEINAPPLLPLAAGEERERMIQFPLPKKLLPSIFAHVTAGQYTPLRLNYYFELEFMTEKGDRHTIQVPVNMEDNYPPRAPQPPPPMPSESQPWATQAPPPVQGTLPPQVAPPASPYSDAPPAYRNVSASSVAPPPSYGQPPPNQSFGEQAPPPQFDEPTGFASSSQPGLYPHLPGTTAYQPTKDSFTFEAPPPFNPAYSSQH